MKTKNFQIYLSESEYAVVCEAARRADMSVSRYGGSVMLQALELNRKPDQPEVLVALSNFQRLFCEAMELSIQGKLTVPRFRGLVERRSA